MEQLLKVNMFPFRSQNSTIGFIFNDVNSDGIVDTTDILKLSKWIGKKPNTIEDIKNVENVLDGTFVDFVKYEITYTDDSIYRSPLFKLNKWDSMKVIIDSLAVKYKEHYKYGWYDKNPENDITYFEKDPVFAERVFISSNSKITMIGDIHSSLHSLLDIFYDLRNKGYFKNDSFELKEGYYVIFLGDIIDRGPYSVELLLFIFILKDKNFNQVYIINGNHEDLETYEHYDFQKETENQLGTHHLELEKILYFLPSVIYLKFGDKLYHLSHGALPDQDDNEDQKIIEKIYIFLNSKKDEESLEFPKFLLLSGYDPHNALKWGDFRIANGYEPGNEKNNGRPQFGYDIVEQYCNELGITSLITGHQDIKPLLIIPRINAVKDYENNYNKAIIFVGNNNNKFLKHDLKNQYVDTNLVDEKDIHYEDEEGIFQMDDYEYIEIETETNQKYKEDCDTDIDEFGYDLYGICKKKNFVMSPEDFLALTTSTATISREISHTTYLELLTNGNN